MVDIVITGKRAELFGMIRYLGIFFIYNNGKVKIITSNAVLGLYVSESKWRSIAANYLEDSSKKFVSENGQR